MNDLTNEEIELLCSCCYCHIENGDDDKNEIESLFIKVTGLSLSEALNLGD